MKNIHLMPTDKPSRLHEFGNIWFSHKEPTECFRNYNIYITCDEEIKEGDWVLSGNKIYQIKESAKDFLNHVQGISKKIILTTDQDLIKDGVQAIDDKFLEWFVKNPSCEFVEIQCRYNFYAGQDLTHYKIIIPQEESKPIHQQIIDIVGGEDRFKEIAGLKPKKEILKEAKKVYQKALQDSVDLSFYDGVNLGAKWQAERMYSEEEVLDLLHKRFFDLKFKKDTRTTKEWFENFKKK